MYSAKLNTCGCAGYRDAYRKKGRMAVAPHDQVRESTFDNVKVAELEAWLRRTGGAPRDVALWQKVRS